MSKSVLAQIVGFVGFVVVLIVAARALTPEGKAPRAGEVIAAGVPLVPMPTPTPTPAASAPVAPAAPQPAGSAPRISYAQLPPTALPPLFVVRDGKPLALAGARDKPMLLHLWASWCGPCVKELPDILAFGRKGAVEVIAVSVDDHFESVQRYFKGTIPPEVAWDQKITLEPTLGVGSLPTTFLIDKQGRARLRWNGLQSWGGPAMAQLITTELTRDLSIEQPSQPPRP